MNGPAFSLALLLWAQRNTPEPEADVAYAIAELHEDWSEERKSDLYALLVEALDDPFPTMFNHVLLAVKQAYVSNERWAARHG